MERLTFFFLAILVSFIFQIHGFCGGKGEIVRRILLGLLDEPVKDQNAAPLHTEQTRAIRPSVLNAHEVEADGLTVRVVQAPQPVPT